MATIKEINLDKPYMPYKRYEDKIEPRAQIFSVDYDGVNIVKLLMDREDMTFDEAVKIIAAEGGSVDDQGIVRRGSAKYNVDVSETRGEYMALEKYKSNDEGSIVKQSNKITHVHLTIGKALGRLYMGKHVLQAMMSKEVKEWETANGWHKEREMTMGLLLEKLGKENYYVGSDGIIRYVAARVPTAEEDAYGVYAKLTK